MKTEKPLIDHYLANEDEYRIDPAGRRSIYHDAVDAAISVLRNEDPVQYGNLDAETYYSYIEPKSWKLDVKDSIQSRISDRIVDINMNRVKMFQHIKHKYDIPDNLTLANIIGLKKELLDQFEDPKRRMNVNVFYALCLFFETPEITAKRFSYYYGHTLGSVKTDEIFIAYLHEKCYDFADFVDTVNEVYSRYDLEVDDFYDLEKNPSRKRYGPYSIGDCINDDGTYRYDEIIESRREMFDYRMKTNNMDIVVKNEFD